MNILITGADGQLGSEIRDLSSSFNGNFFFTDYKIIVHFSNKAIEIEY